MLYILIRIIIGKERMPFQWLPTSGQLVMIIIMIRIIMIFITTIKLLTIENNGCRGWAIVCSAATRIMLLLIGIVVTNPVGIIKVIG